MQYESQLFPKVKASFSLTQSGFKHGGQTCSSLKPQHGCPHSSTFSQDFPISSIQAGDLHTSLNAGSIEGGA
jgi:hypothetical protein